MAWLWVATLAVVCFATGTATHWALLQHLGYGLLGVDGLAWLAVVLGRRGLLVTHGVDRARATVGEEITESYSAQGGRWCLALRVEIVSPEGDTAVLPGRAFQITRKRRLTRRGRLHPGGGTLTVSDPFGLVRLPLGQVEPSEVMVYPRPVAVDPGMLVTSGRLAGRQRALPAADGTLGNLRPYQTGDAPSRIHWRSSARSGTLLVAEPEVEQRRATWLLVDLGGGAETAESGAGLAAFLAAQLAGAGEAVGAIVAGKELVVVPARHAGDNASLLEPLATVEACDDAQVERLTRAAPRYASHGSVMFLISPSPEAPHAARRLQRVAPVVVVTSSPLPGETAGAGA